MGNATGLPFAALSRMILDGKLSDKHKTGVFAPEAWVDSQTFYQYMNRYGVSESTLMLPITEETVN